MSDIYKKLFHKKINLILAIIIFALGASLYWFAIRPTNIKKSCSNVSVKPYSQEEKDNAKKKFDDNHCSFVSSYTRKRTDNKIDITVLGITSEQAKQTFSNLSRDEIIKKIDEIVKDRKNQCLSLEKIFNSPDKEWQRQATNEEYSICLRNNGVDIERLVVDNQKLENIQQSIDDQSEKIENLKDNNTQVKTENSPLDVQSVIKSTQEKSDKENQAKCQQELTEYNSCLSDYNSKLAEYNSCLNESANPNSWSYGKGSFCFKPTNYCFKPLCAY